ncbi:Ig-like domain-containing protein [Patescibacteria group bacterium]|nr:Ig-like domain-containing protein [Patescibacteria group bacterium]
MKNAPRIPTIVGLLLVCLIAGIFIFAFNQVTELNSRAAASETPSAIQVANIGDTSFSMTWTTPDAATGQVELSQPGTGNATFFDDRDLAAATGKSVSRTAMARYVTHIVTIRSLNPNTTYSLRIISNGRTYDDSGAPYSVRTGPILSEADNGLKPAYGQVNTQDNTPATDALVFVTLDDGSLLGTAVTSNGTWLIPLNVSRTKSLDHYVAAGERLPIAIRVVSGTLETTAMTDSLNASPVPLMVLGKTYDFRKIQAKNSGSPLANAPAGGTTPAVLGAETQTPTGQNFHVSLTSPAEGAALTGTTPLVEGTGFPGNTVSLVLGITSPVSGSTKVGTDGVWRFTPSTALAEGRQSVTMTTADAAGKPVAITHMFTILKSGSQVLGDATPSATLEPAITATPTAEPTTIAAQPIPTTGTELPTIIMIVMGIGFLASGAVVFLK